MGRDVVMECVCAPRVEQVFSSINYEELCVCSVMLSYVNTLYFGYSLRRIGTRLLNVLEVLQILFDRCLRKTDLV